MAGFDDECIALLVERNPRLYNLQLSELGKLSDLSLPFLHPLKCLTSLDISRAGVIQGMVLTDDAVVALLENVGENLVDLVLDRASYFLLDRICLYTILTLPAVFRLTENYLLTDRVLIEGIKIHCPHLRSLSLRQLSEIQSTGFQSLFTDWINTGLTHLDIHRCLKLEDEALEALVTHSGHSLRKLDMHSVDEVTDVMLAKMAEGCGAMEELDVSFVRAVDDFVVKAFLDKMEVLKVLFVWGNNRVSDACPQRVRFSSLLVLFICG